MRFLPYVSVNRRVSNGHLCLEYEKEELNWDGEVGKGNEHIRGELPMCHLHIIVDLRMSCQAVVTIVWNLKHERCARLCAIFGHAPWRWIHKLLLWIRHHQILEKKHFFFWKELPPHHYCCHTNRQLREEETDAAVQDKCPKLEQHFVHCCCTTTKCLLLITDLQTKEIAQNPVWNNSFLLCSNSWKHKRARSKFQILEQKTNTLKRHCTETEREIDRDKEICICLYFDSSFSKARRKVRCNVCGRKYLPFSSRIRSISASPAHASATVFIVKQVRGNPACSTTVTTRCCCSRHSYPPWPDSTYLLATDCHESCNRKPTTPTTKKQAPLCRCAVLCLGLLANPQS